MAYLDKNIKYISDALKKGEVSSNDLVKEAISKINEHKDINAFNLVMENAQESDVNNHILSGIPYALKDNISTKGILTTASSNTLKDYVPVYDATCYQKLKEKGAVLIGKTNLDELAMGGTGTTGNTGIVRNPWNKEYIAGGSSAGSAACVSLGITPYAIGSDTGDSIRKPAAYCGIVGFKPSYGLISRYGLFAFASSLDHVGCFTRSVMDAAIVTDAIKGYDPKDMTSIKDMDDISLTSSLDGNVQGKKLFYIKEICDKKNYDDPRYLELLDVFEKNLELAKKAGFEIYEESMDINLLSAIKPIYDCISCAEVTSNNSNLTGIIFGPRGKGDNIFEMIKNHRTEGFSPLIKRRFVIGSFVLQKENQEKYFLNAKRVRRLICNKIDEFFTKYDGLILPVPNANKIEESTNKIMKAKDNMPLIMENHLDIGNFGGYPSITIPSGFVNNLPVGLNITGKFKDDANVLNMAYAIENMMEYKNITSGGDK